ncbi:MAG TPA: hypothetical protein VNT20_20565 [Flavisolibacter sp.]|jgi:hypothetical protein|nr:hypothetical protein [Flavisolibacter sp.]
MTSRRWFIRYKKTIAIGGGILFALFILLLFFVNRFIEPILKDRLHTLIIQGSDSLYTYTLGRLNANFYGGNVEVENLQVKVDSTRYEYLKRRNALPSLTMQLSLQRGRVKGVGIIDLLFGKKIRIEEIMSKQANVVLSRHIRKGDIDDEKLPVWKAIQPKIKSIYVGKIKLDGIKLLYKNADTSEAVKLQFDRCDADFNDILIDSAASVDTTRIGFIKDISMKFNDLKYRTSDSTYKMKAKWIKYSSKERTLEIDSFKLQPTLDRKDFYEAANRQTSLYNIEFTKVRFVNTRLDHFIHNNVIDADSVVFEKPDVKVYTDKSLPPDFESKIGKFPHQQLLKAGTTIDVKHISFKDASFELTEKDGKTNQEGTLNFAHVNFAAHNITNETSHIKKNPVCSVNFSGTIFNSSPVALNLKLYLDSTNGRFDASGSVKNVSSSQLNEVAVPLANVQINSCNIHDLEFNVSGEDYSATANVRMRYNNLSITLRKTDEETGETKTKKFLTKILNRFVIWPDNPGNDGIERTAQNTRVARLTTQSFFGLIWKTIFAGMQDVMMKSGRYQ